MGEPSTFGSSTISRSEKNHHLSASHATTANMAFLEGPDALVPAPVNTRGEDGDMRTPFGFLLAVTLLFGSSCGSELPIGKPIKTGDAGNGLTVSLNSRDGVLRDGENRLYLIFRDSNGKFVDVDSASLNFHMPAMGTMPVMNDAATLTTTRKSGVYDAKVKLQMGGEWLAQIAYEGRAGKGKVTLPMSAQ